jgi:phage tail-like protein
MTDALSRLSRVITNAAPTFRFVVMVNGAPYGVFSECDLPVVEWETQPIKEGGLNTRVHHLLGRRKETKLTLKNGVGTSAFIAWYLATMAGIFDAPGAGLRRSVTVILLNSLKVPVMTWHIEEALPTKWSGPQLKTSENSVAIQSLELSCGEITIIPGVGLG